MMHYFVRCKRCHALITRLQMIAALKKGPELCACGSGTIQPTNPRGSEWLTLPVLRMIVWKLLGLLEPAPESEMPAPVPVGIRVPALSRAEQQMGQDETELL